MAQVIEVVEYVDDEDWEGDDDADEQVVEIVEQIVRTRPPLKRASSITVAPHEVGIGVQPKIRPTLRRSSTITVLTRAPTTSLLDSSSHHTAASCSSSLRDGVDIKYLNNDEDEWDSDDELIEIVETVTRPNNLKRSSSLMAGFGGQPLFSGF